MKEQTLVDKSAWPAGPWRKEPDRVSFEHAGLPCLLRRQMSSGHWCGYVAVPPGHPLHGKPYDDADARVHGGLTYSDECMGDPETGICHVPKPGEPDNVWWFGFDCAHYGDKSYFAEEVCSHFFEGDYWDVDMVMHETRQLAEQLAEQA